MGTKAVAQAKQGQWLNWEGVDKKKLSWKELWSMEERSIKFLIGVLGIELPICHKAGIHGNINKY